jgi:imidazolonepropionase-like amidohydrolase
MRRNLSRFPASTNRGQSSLAAIRFSALFAGLVTVHLSAAEPIAVRGEMVYPVSSAPITNGVVLIRDGKIQSVGPATETTLEPGTRTVDAKIVTPGLIDAHCTVGISGILNIPHDQDQLEKSAAIQPDLRALDSYNPRDALVSWVRQLGVTTLHTGPAPGALIPGQTMVVKTWPENADAAVLVPTAMLAATLGPGALSEAKDKPPGTAAKAVAMLRSELIKAREYAHKRDLEDVEKRPARDLRLEVLTRVLAGELPLLITAHRHQDIIGALRLANEFDLRLVLDGLADAHLVLAEIQSSGFPVIVHPPMARADSETENLSIETPVKLRSAGVLFAFQSGFESYVPKTRVVILEAAIARSNGLSFDDTLRALTLDSARILGVQDQIGSLEPGKDADLALFDGDPFEYVTHCTGTIVSGELVNAEAH